MLTTDRFNAASPEVSHFLNTVLNRANTPMEPVSYKVNWDDAPLHHKVYLDVARRPLPRPFRAMPDTSVSEAIPSVASTPPNTAIDEDVLSDLLVCYGHLDRRTEQNWNEDSKRKLSPSIALWGRPTASGGGMYPLEQYVVAGAGSQWSTGIGHYDAINHALGILDRADHTETLAAATGVKAASYLVVTCRFWKNSFKYNTFCHHVVSQDLGCLVASWRTAAAAHGVSLSPILYFNDRLVCETLGIDGLHEAPYAVLPLEPVPGDIPASPRANRPVGGELGHDVLEVSHTTRTFPLGDKAHAACFSGEIARPSAAPLHPDFIPTGTSIQLPHVQSDMNVEEALRERRSGFGVFSRAAGMTITQLAGALEFVANYTTEPTDVAPQGREPWVGQWVIVAGVKGLPDGAYRYDDVNHRLVQSGKAQLHEAQRFYPLTNYSLGEVSVIHVMTVRLEEMLESLGDRGMRVAGVEVGQAGQAMYLGAAAFGFGAGAVLGLDNLEIDKLLGIEDADEQSLLCHLLGAHRPTQSRAPLPLHIEGTQR